MLNTAKEIFACLIQQHFLHLMVYQGWHQPQQFSHFNYDRMLSFGSKIGRYFILIPSLWHSCFVWLILWRRIVENSFQAAMKTDTPTLRVKIFSSIHQYFTLSPYFRECRIPDDEPVYNRSYPDTNLPIQIKNELFDMRVNSVNLTSSSLLPPPTREHHSANTEKEN